MEPMMSAAIGRIVGELVVKSAAGIRKEKVESTTAIPLGDYAFQDSVGDIQAIVSQAQLDEISRFLETKEVFDLLQRNYIAHLLCPTSITEGIDDLARTSFDELTKNWCDKHNQEWRSISGFLWEAICSSTQAAFPVTSPNSDFLLNADEAEEIGLHSLLATKSSTPKYLREILDIAVNSSRQQRAREHVADIQAAAGRLSSEMRLQHTHEEHRFDYERLYIDRDLRRAGREQPNKSDSLMFEGKSPVRIVVLGDPGVGKSTLVRHTVHTAAKNKDHASRIAPILVTCKDYSFDPNDRAASFGEAILRTLESEYNLRISVEALEDLLNLGRVLLILDGVDEIVDLGKRRRFIERADTFVSNYPLISVLATTRRIGYRKAQFSRRFEEFELSEFSGDQISEYTKKWFNLAQRPEADRLHLMRELESVDDIAPNPLMLSLLCTLYRSRGYIPKNRREVYKECAELLFRRWDSMRHIEQPFDHRQYGTRLMQELAVFFYRSPSAQAGVEEQQLRRIISHFFVDTASVEPELAIERAQAFLNFCADRAWLLSSQGFNDRDQKIFSFTHRTFKEYYAAEGVVRRSNSIESIADEVAAAYEADPSSVLPDVIVQCADDRYDNGNSAIVLDLLERDTRNRKYGRNYIPLCLRIVSAAPVKPSVLDKLFSRLNVRWLDQDPAQAEEEIRAILELYRDPRARFLRMVQQEIDAGTVGALAFSLVARWALVYLSDSSYLYDGEWPELLEPAVKFVSQFTADEITDASLNMLVDLGKIEPREIPEAYRRGKLFAIRGFGEDPLQGTVLRAFERVCLGQGNALDRDLEIVRLATASLDTMAISADDVRCVTDALDASLMRHGENIQPSNLFAIDPETFGKFTVWLSCISWEIADGWGREYYCWDLLKETPEWEIFLRMVATRQKNLRAFPGGREKDRSSRAKKPWDDARVFTRNEQAKIIKNRYGKWAVAWCKAAESRRPLHQV